MIAVGLSARLVTHRFFDYAPKRMGRLLRLVPWERVRLAALDTARHGGTRRASQVSSSRRPSAPVASRSTLRTWRGASSSMMPRTFGALGAEGGKRAPTRLPPIGMAPRTH